MPKLRLLWSLLVKENQTQKKASLFPSLFNLVATLHKLSDIHSFQLKISKQLKILAQAPSICQSINGLELEFGLTIIKKVLKFGLMEFHSVLLKTMLNSYQNTPLAGDILDLFKNVILITLLLVRNTRLKNSQFLIEIAGTLLGCPS